MKMFDWLLTLKYRIHARPQSKRRPKDHSAQCVSVPSEVLEARKLMTTIMTSLAADAAQSSSHDASSSKPDIVATSFNVLNDRVDNGTARVEFTAANQGLGTADNVAFAIIHSEDSIVGNDDDIRVGTATVEHLAPGASTRVGLEVELDRQLLAARSQRDNSGTTVLLESDFVQYLAVVSDPDNQIEESNENGISAAEDNNANLGLYIDSDNVTALPADVDQDGIVAPLDALQVISAIGSPVTSLTERYDLDMDGVIAPLDALSVISQIGYTVNTADLTLNAEEDTAFAGNLGQKIGGGSSSNWSLTDGPTHGHVTVTANGDFVFTPDGDFDGEDAFTVSSQSGDAISEFTVEVNVAAVNDSPFVKGSAGKITLTDTTPSIIVDLRTLFGDADDSLLTYSLESDNADLVTAVIVDTELRLNAVKEKRGTTTVKVRAKDSAGLSAQISLPIELIAEPPVNTSPEVQRPIQNLTVKQGIQESLIDLSGVFTDADGDQLALSVGNVSNAELVGANIEGTTLRLSYASNIVGQSLITIAATDPSGATVNSAFTVTVDQAEATVSSALIADQVIDNGGRSVVRLAGAASRAGKLKVSSSNGNVLAADDIQMTIVGDDVEFEIQHQSDDYGVSVLSLSDGDTRIADFVAIVLPTEDVTYEQAGNLNLDIEAEAPGVDTKSSTLKVSYNDRALALMVRKGAMSSHDATALVHPITTVTRNGLDPDEFPDEAWQVVHLSANGDAPPVTQNTVTLSVGISKTEEVDLFDQFDSGLGIVAEIADELDRKNDSVVERLVKQAKSKAIHELFNYSVKGINKLIDVLDPDNDIDLNPAGEILWGVKSLTEDFADLMIDIAVPNPKNKAEIVFSSIQFASSFVSLANTVRHIGFDKAADAVVSSTGDSVAGLTEGILSQVSEFGEVTGLNSVMESIPTTSQLGTKLKGYANKTVEAEEVLDAGSETFEKIALAKEYVSTGIEIANHVEAIWKELFGPDDLYVDIDGVERRWSDDQHRHPTPGRDNVTTGTGNDTVDSGKGNDKIQTNSGDDRVLAGEGDNQVDTGSGADFIRDGSGDSFLTAGMGADIVEDEGGNDVINLGPGRDTLVYRGLDIGRDLVYDDGRTGEIHLLSISENDISFSKQGNDLAISIAKTGVILNDEIRIVDFFRNEVTDFTLRTKDGNAIDLRAATGRLSHQDAALLALQSYGDVADYQDSLPTGIQHTATITDSATGLHAEVFRGTGPDRNTDESHAYVVIRGSERSLEDWLINNVAAGLPQANSLIEGLRTELSAEELRSVTLIGHSSGGMVAQWAGTYFASRDVPFVNVTTLNSPEISGRIQNVLAEEFEEYAYGLPSLSATHIVDLNDPVSKLGFWAGRGLGASTWVTWESENNSISSVPSLADLLSAHTPEVDEFSGIDKEFTILQPNEVQRHVGIRKSVDVTRYLHRRNSASSTTDSLFDLFLDSGNVDLSGNEETSKVHEQTFTQTLLHDSNAGVTFSKKYDFGPVDSNVEPGYSRISETTLYVTEAGWLTANDDLKSQDRGRATDMKRDFVATSENTFVVDLPSEGTYNVTFTTGDRSQIRESMVYYVNGFYYDTVSTMPGQFLTHGFQITTSDAQLQIAIKDRGGESDRAIINGLTVEKVHYGVDAPGSTVVQDDGSLVILTHGYTIPGGVAAVFDTIKETVSKTIAAAKDVAAVSAAFAKGGHALAALKATEISLRRVREALAEDNDSVRANSRVHDWVFDAAEEFAAMSRRFRLGKLDANVVPVEFSTAWQAISQGKSGKQLLKQWQGSRDFLALDWTDESSEGAGVFELLKGDFSEEAHRDAVEMSASIYKALIDARIAELRESDPTAKLDVLLVSHSYGYNVNRDLAEQISYSDTADAVDYLKLVTLDPVSMKPDELQGTKRQSDRLNWYHPELTPAVDAVDNYFQTEGVFHTKFTSVALAGGLIGAAVHKIAGNIEDQIVFGQPLDGREGGGVSGFYNRQARIFDMGAEEEILRFRHWDTNEIKLSTAELTDIEFSPDGSLVAASGKDGTVTVRYVDDVPDPDPNVETPLHSAGDVKFEVWGQESIVRSTAFIQIEVEGEWKDFLLTVSASRNPENRDVDKNKVLLTDVETGLPVWQGHDNGGTQVEASPSGNVIVSADANGHAKIWTRVPGTVTFEQHEKFVDVHPGGAYIADLMVINDEYFVTAGLDRKLKLVQITDEGARVKWSYNFDNQGQGKVRNLDYDPYNGVLAVASGNELSFWKFDQQTGTLSVWGPEGQPADNVFGIQDHIKNVQGVAFSKPAFLLNEEGLYNGDRDLPRTELGDVDIEALQKYLSDNNLPDSFAGLKLITGGEDRTLFLYSLDELDRGYTPKESVLSGAMLPVREVTISPDGRRVAVVGQDNVEGEFGGPVKDLNVTSEIDKRLGFSFSELFIGGLREHNEVPPYYFEDVVGVTGESYFWQRNNDAASRSGDLDKDKNLALPPNKRANSDGLDVAPIDLQVRPGKKVEIKPLRYLIEVDREDYQISNESLSQFPAEVRDADDNLIGEIRQKKVDGKLKQNVLVFEAVDDLDFSADDRREYTGVVTVTLTGPADADGQHRTVDAEIEVQVINHKPVLYRDVIELHPNRSELDFRPKANDYDFDNDDFNLHQFPESWQDLEYQGEVVARYRKTPGNVNGVDVKTIVSEDRLLELLDHQANNREARQEPQDFLTLTFDYQMRENRYKSISDGIVEIRLKVQSGPANVKETEVGADQFVINWEPVSWNATKYVIQRFDAELNEWVKHSDNSDVSGRKSDSKAVKKLQPNTDYWFRVVAVNENSGRRHASFEGDGPGGLHVRTPDYVAVDVVTPEVLGAKQIEVSWSKVYWDVAKYEVQLRKLVVDGDGNLELNSDGTFKYLESETKSHDVVPGENNGNGRSWVFRNLDSDTWYLAAVVAKNGSKNVAKEQVAGFPVSTADRQLPSAVDIQRLGPGKARISWSKVSFAERYRIVAVDPRNPLDEGSRIIEGFDATRGGSGTRSEILTGLKPQTEYVVFVEARDKDGIWSSVLPADTTGRIIRLLDNTEFAPGESQIDLTSDLKAASRYVLPHDFDTVLRLPSSDGAFVGTEAFSVFNLSEQAVIVEAVDGEFINGQQRVTLSPAVGPSRNADAPGSLILPFVRTLDGWTVDIANSASTARRIATPTFLASEAGSFGVNEDESRPKMLRLEWESPFWNVKTHRVHLYEAVLNADGEPFKDAAGKWVHSDSPADSSSLIDVAAAADRFFAREFSGLVPDKQYIAELVTKGNSGLIVRELISVETVDQNPPSGVRAEDIGRDSFVATWTTVTWNAKAYRVRYEELDDSGNAVPGSLKYEKVEASKSVAKSNVKIKGLTAGQSYRFTVEVQNGQNEWIENTLDNTKVVTLSNTVPSNVTASSITADSLKVSWQHEGNGGVKFYRIRVKPHSESVWDSKHVVGDVSANGPFELTVNKLKASTEYDVQVRAIYVKADPANGVKQDAVDVETKSPVKTASLTEISSFSIAESRRTQVDFSWVTPAGTESLRLEWTGNGKSGSVVVTGLSRKTIDFREGGSYEVTLIAQSGDSTVRASLTATPVGYPAPDAPVLKTGTVPGRRQFEIQWEFPGDPLGNVEEFRIVRDTGKLFGVAGSDANTKVIQTRTSDRVDVTVNPNTDYRLKVVAVYKNGTKVASDYTTFKTAGGIAPSGLRVSGTESRQTTLHWTHSDMTGVDFFRIRKSTDGGATWEVVGDAPTKDRSKTITGLSPNTTYHFQVRAIYRTEASGGEWESYDAQTGAVRTKDVSLTGVRVTGVRRKQFDVAWDSVADWAGSTKVQWRRAGTTNWSGSGSMGGGKTNYEITGLNHNTNYEIRVTASGGGVERSMTISRQTANVVKPSSPTYSGVSQTQVTVNWTHSDPAGPAEGFAVFRNGSKIADVGANARNFVAKGLKSGTTYSFQIRAKYGVGNADGPASSIMTKTPVYHTPTGLSASNVKKQEFTVHWSFAGNLSDVDKFRVFRTNGKLLGITSTLQKTIKDRNNPPVVIDIKPGVEYEVFVRAIYKDGHKSDSGTITIKTLK